MDKTVKPANLSCGQAALLSKTFCIRITKPGKDMCKRAVLAFIGSLIFAVRCSADIAPDEYVPGLTGWQTETWADKSDTYRAVRLQIQRQVDRSEDRLNLVSFYKREAELKPQDPLSVFKWAVASEEAIHFITGENQYFLLMHGLMSALATPTSPQNREYDRIRYLVSVEYNWQDPGLTSVGDRLLRSDESDEEVLIQVAFSHSANVRYAATLLKRASNLDPYDPQPHKYLAYTYLDAFERNMSQTYYGRYGIQELEKYLSLSPIDQDAAAQARHYIAETKSDLARAGKLNFPRFNRHSEQPRL